MHRTNWRTAINIIIVMMFMQWLFGCGGSNEAENAKGNGTTNQDKVVMTGESLDAVNFLIAANSLSSSFNPIDVSPDLKEWLSQFSQVDNQVKYSLDIKGCAEPLLADGAKTIIPAGARFGGTLEGALNADILLEDGEVGIINGAIFVAEGTNATVNGELYTYSGSSWIMSDSAAPTE